MAAQKSTASASSRTSKATNSARRRTTSKRAKPSQEKASATPPTAQPAERIRSVPVFVCVGPDCDEAVYLSRCEAESFAETHNELNRTKLTIEERTATITDAASRVTSAEPYGIMLGDRIIATDADIDGALAVVNATEGAYLVRLLTNDRKTAEAELASLPPLNPLAEQLQRKHSRTLAKLQPILGENFCLSGLRGIAPLVGGQLGCRTATDDEAALLTLDLIGRDFAIDANNDIGPQVLEHLRTLIRDLQTTANRLETAMQRGKIPGPVARRGKAVSA